MGRQFIAVVPQGLAQNSELKKLMGKLKRTMDERGQEARWISPRLWHVTLQFLGEVSADRVGDLWALLSDWNPPIGELAFRLHGLGAFPSPEEARVLWIGVQASQELIDLQDQLAAELTAQGFSLGDREFKPHLTLARFRNTINATDLVKLGGRKHFGDYRSAELILFESVLQGNILKYVPQFRRALNGSGSVPTE